MATKIQAAYRGWIIRITAIRASRFARSRLAVHSATPEVSAIHKSANPATAVPQVLAISVLLDGCTDASIFSDERMYISKEPPRLRTINTGAKGSSIKFEYMGTCKMKVAAPDEEGGVYELLIHNCHKPSESAPAAFNLICLNEAWMKQGIWLEERGVDVLHVGNVRIPIKRRGHIPTLTVVPVTTQQAVVAAAHAASRSDKHISLRLQHHRYMHVNFAKVAKLMNVPLPNNISCHCCKIFKSIAPTPDGIKREYAIGELVHIDAWGPFPHPAVATGHKHILGAMDSCSKVPEAWGTLEPNGAMAARFVRHVILLYASQYKVNILKIRFDNASIFNCNEVTVVLAEFKVSKDNSAEYVHWQLMIEMIWKPMQRDAACAIAFAKLGKGYFIHAALHALMVRSLITIDEGRTVTRYELLSKQKPPLQLLRIFGSPMYGHLMQEQRKAMKLDKSDPRAVYGVFGGIMLTKRAWLNITPVKVYSHASAYIDERTLLSQAPSTQFEQMNELSSLAFDDKQWVEAASGTVVDMTAEHENHEPVVPTSQGAQQFDKPKAPIAREQRVRFEIDRLDPGACVTGKPCALKAAPPKPRSTQQVLVPAVLYPSYEEVHEFGGRGWLGNITSSTKEFARIEYVHAQDSRGVPFEPVRLRHNAYEKLDEHGQPTGLDGNGDTLANVTVSKQASASHVQNAIIDEAFARDTPSSRQTMLEMGAVCAAHRLELVNFGGKPVWSTVPRSWLDVTKHERRAHFEIAMDSFLDKTRGVQGFEYVAYDDPRIVALNLSPKEIARVLWVFKYKDVQLATAREAARLVFDNSSVNSKEDPDDVQSGVCMPLTWRTLLHLGAVLGATIVRRDIVNAHQTTKMEEYRVTHTPPGRPIRIDGKHALMLWFNFLNGMPKAGRGWSKRVHVHLLEFGMHQLIQDPYTYVIVTELGFLWLACVVDDFLIVTQSKGDALLAKFDEDLKRLGQSKHFGIDGFLNYEIAYSVITRQLTLRCTFRIEEMMREHDMAYMDKKMPDTPWHPQIKDLRLGEPALKSNKLAKQTYRLMQQINYITCHIRFDAQHASFYQARFASGWTQLLWECVLHTLRYLYGTRQMGLTLGGAGGECTITRARLLSSHAMVDAGIAEDGPSTGGGVIQMGEATLHASSGRHVPVTMASASAEGYELSRQVPIFIHHRYLLEELGCHQPRPTAVGCDNSAVVSQVREADSMKRSLYLRRRIKFVSMAEDDGLIRVYKVAGKLNLADILTKVLSPTPFARLRHALLGLDSAIQAVAAHSWHVPSRLVSIELENE